MIVGSCCAGWGFATRLLGCSFDGARCLVSELCRLMVVWVDCRYYVCFVLPGGARCLNLSACNTAAAATLRNWPPNQHRPAGSATLSSPNPTRASAVPSAVRGIQAPHSHDHVPVPTSAPSAATDMVETEHSAATAPNARPDAAATTAAAATAVQLQPSQFPL